MRVACLETGKAEARFVLRNVRRLEPDEPDTFQIEARYTRVGFDVTGPELDLFGGIRGGGNAYGLVVSHSDLLVRNNDIHDCGRRSVSYNVYTDNGRSTPDLVF